MNEQTIPSSYRGGVRQEVSNPYNFEVVNVCEAYCNFIKTNMVRYARKYIPNYIVISDIPEEHLPAKLDRLGYEDNWYAAFEYMENLVNIPKPFYNWNGVTNIAYLFADCSKLNDELPDLPDTIENMYGAFSNCIYLETPKFPSSCYNMGNAYRNCIRLKGPIPQFPNNFNSNANVSLDSVFYNCSNLTGNIPAFPNNKNIQDLNLSYTFSNCRKLSGEFPKIPNNTTDISGTFNCCKNLKGNLPEIPDTVTHISYAFNGCWNANGMTKNIPNSIQDMAYAFSNCVNAVGTIPNLPSNIVLDKNGLVGTFYNCRSLIGSFPNLSNIKTNSISLRETFVNCRNLTGNLPSIDKATDLVYTFINCVNTTGNAPVIPNGVTNAFGCFAECDKLTGISFTNFPSSLNNIGYLFHYCHNIKSTIPNWYNTNIVDISEAFAKCNKIYGNIPPFPETAQNFHGTLYSCKNLTGSIPNIPTNAYAIDNFVTYCTNITGKYPNIPQNVKTATNAFRGMTKMSPSNVYVFSNNMTNCHDMYYGSVNRVNIFVHANTKTYNSFKQYFDNNNYNASWNAYLYTF